MKKNKKPDTFAPLDDEERALMASVEAGEWQPIEDLVAEKTKLVQVARNTLRKNKRINLRLTPKDYELIQIKAVEEGLPYQTLISSIVHKYLNGTLHQ